METVMVDCMILCLHVLAASQISKHGLPYLTQPNLWTNVHLVGVSFHFWIKKAQDNFSDERAFQ